MILNIKVYDPHQAKKLLEELKEVIEKYKKLGTVSQYHIGAKEIGIDELITGKHNWFRFKKDIPRSCKICGVIENENNTNKDCKGKPKVELRSLQDE